MQAIRVIRKPRNRRVVVDLPACFETATQVEVIVLGVDDREDVPAASIDGAVKRRPSSKLAGTIITGDIMASVLSEWAE